MVSPAEYREFTKGLMTDYDHDHNLLHFTSGIITEYTEYLKELHDDEPGDHGLVWEIGDILFYCYAAANELIELAERCHDNPEEAQDEKIVMGMAHPDAGEAFFQFRKNLDSGNLMKYFSTDESAPWVKAWFFAKPLERIQKWVYHGRTLNLTEFKQDLKNCLCLVGGLCAWNGTSLEDCMNENVRKLQKRHPDGFRGVSWKNDGPATG